jgi:hypothetical protein
MNIMGKGGKDASVIVPICILVKFYREPRYALFIINMLHDSYKFRFRSTNPDAVHGIQKRNNL